MGLVIAFLNMNHARLVTDNFIKTYDKNLPGCHQMTELNNVTFQVLGKDAPVFRKCPL